MHFALEAGFISLSGDNLNVAALNFLQNPGSSAETFGLRVRKPIITRPAEDVAVCAGCLNTLTQSMETLSMQLLGSDSAQQASALAWPGFHPLVKIRG